MSAANRVIFMYGFAALASICIPLGLGLAASSASQPFPQASHDQLVRAVRNDLPMMVGTMGLSPGEASGDGTLHR